MIEERYMHDPVPKNVSKFPIHQTYLTSDAELTGSGGWKFKCPEVWSSARSGKKSIAIRSIKWASTKIRLAFELYVVNVSNPNSLSNVVELKFDMAIPAYNNTQQILTTIKKVFDDQITYRFSEEYIGGDTQLDESIEKEQHFDFSIDYIDNILTFEVKSKSGTAAGTYALELHTAPIGNQNIIDNSFQRVFNQPYTTLSIYNSVDGIIRFKDVWDRSDTDPLYFHASFIPFDNYQYLGSLGDSWNTPIVYQDPNTSPLFNIWTTTDMKNIFKILHEPFIIRFTFIISTESQYSS